MLTAAPTDDDRVKQETPATEDFLECLRCLPLSTLLPVSVPHVPLVHKALSKPEHKEPVVFTEEQRHQMNEIIRSKNHLMRGITFLEDFTVVTELVLVDSIDVCNIFLNSGPLKTAKASKPEKSFSAALDDMQRELHAKFPVPIDHLNSPLSPVSSNSLKVRIIRPSLTESQPQLPKSVPLLSIKGKREERRPSGYDSSFAIGSLESSLEIAKFLFNLPSDLPEAQILQVQTQLEKLISTEETPSEVQSPLSYLLVITGLCRILWQLKNTPAGCRSEEHLAVIVLAVKSLSCASIENSAREQKKFAAYLQLMLQALLLLFDSPLCVLSESNYVSLFISFIRILQDFPNNFLVWKELFACCSKSALLCTQIAKSPLSMIQFFAQEAFSCTHNMDWTILGKRSFPVFLFQMSIAFSTVEYCRSFVQLVCQSLISKITTQDSSDSASQGKCLIENLIADALSLARDILNWPGAELFLRVLVQNLLALLSTESGTFGEVTRCKIIDFIICVWDDLYDVLTEPLDENSIRDFLASNRQQNSFTFSFNLKDLSFEGSLNEVVDGAAAPSYPLAAKELFTTLRQVPSAIIRFLYPSDVSPSTMVKSRCLKFLGCLLQKKNYSLLFLISSNQLFALLQNYLSDQAPSIREATVDLILSLPAIEDLVKPVDCLCLLIGLLQDSSNAVKRRAIKAISSDSMLASVCSDQVDRLTVLARLFDAYDLQRDDSIRGLIRKTANSLLEYGSAAKIANEKHLSFLIFCFKTADFSRHPLICDYLESNPDCLDGLVREIFSSLLIDDCHAENLFSSLSVIAKYGAVHFSRHLLYLANTISELSHSSNHGSIIRHILDILIAAIPAVSLDFRLFQSMEKILILFVAQFPEAIASAAMNCLVLINFRKPSSTTLSGLFARFRDLATIDGPTKLRAVLNCCNLCYFGAMKNLFTQDSIVDLFDLLLSTRDQRDPLVVYVRCLGRLVSAAPMLHTRFSPLIEETMSSSVAQDRLVGLDALLAFFNGCTGSASHSSYSSLAMQFHLPSIIASCKDPFNGDLQRAAFSLVAICLKCGLANPISYFSTVIAFCSHPEFCNEASLLLNIAAERHKTFLFGISLEEVLRSVVEILPPSNLLTNESVALASKRLFCFFSLFSKKAFSKLCLGISSLIEKFFYRTLQENYQLDILVQGIALTLHICSGLVFRGRKNLLSLLRSLNSLPTTVAENDSKLQFGTALALVMINYCRVFLCSKYSISNDQLDESSLSLPVDDTPLHSCQNFSFCLPLYDDLFREDRNLSKISESARKLLQPEAIFTHVPKKTTKRKRGQP